MALSVRIAFGGLASLDNMEGGEQPDPLVRGRMVTLLATYEKMANMTRDRDEYKELVNEAWVNLLLLPLTEPQLLLVVGESQLKGVPMKHALKDWVAHGPPEAQDEWKEWRKQVMAVLEKHIDTCSWLRDLVKTIEKERIDPSEVEDFLIYRSMKRAHRELVQDARSLESSQFVIQGFFDRKAAIDQQRMNQNIEQPAQWTIFD